MSKISINTGTFDCKLYSNVFHKYKPSVALVHGYIKQEANARGYTLAGKKFIVLTAGEIAEATGLSRITSWRAIKVLVKDGLLERIQIQGPHNISYAVM